MAKKYAPPSSMAATSNLTAAGMTASSITFSCPGCGGALCYRPVEATKVIHCDQCNVDYSLDAVDELEKLKNLGQFHWGDYKNEYEKTLQKLENVKVYTCNSCGATLETDPATAATQCPYCSNPVVLNDRLSGGIRPNGIIPFKIKGDGIEKAIRNYYKGKKLLPHQFAVRNMISKIRAVYVPFWLFNTDAQGPMIYEGTEVSHYTEGGYDCTRTDHYQLITEGGISFQAVPVDGSKKMDNDLMDAVCPFDVKELEPFSPAYLSGYLADRFDEDPDESLPRVSPKMASHAASEIAKVLGKSGYTSMINKVNGIDIKNADVKYVLFPVYTAMIRYKDKDYRFAINGQNGKVVGELPISKAKTWLSYWGTAAAFVAAWSSLIYLWFC